jgi:molybdopterin-biosynthesis enzyme MoeA-like protein
MSLRMVLQRECEKPLMKEFHQALDNLKLARRQLDFSDPEYIDTTIFNIGASESRLAAILRQARKERVSAW